MSFRLFICYCALFAAGGALFGWCAGRVVVGGLEWALPLFKQVVLQQGLKAMLLGLGVTLALGLVDALWLFSLRQVVPVALRVGTAVVVGSLGGLFGGLVSQVLIDLIAFHPVIDGGLTVLGWAVTGLLIGASVGVYDLLRATLRGQDNRSAFRKVVNGLIGGAAGGACGGVLSLAVRAAWLALFEGKPADRLWSPSLWGFVALGLFIGLLVGLAQVILKEAWLKVEEGFRRGRELILAKPEVTIGRAEGCDIGLFGDAQVEKLHATIEQRDGRYYVRDAGSGSGTFVNDVRVVGEHPLQAGDAIRVGGCVLRFGERRKSAG